MNHDGIHDKESGFQAVVYCMICLYEKILEARPVSIGTLF
jgi:hypothetical protein